MRFFRLNFTSSFIVAFVVAGIFIGVLVTAQFKSSVTANSYLIDERNAERDLLKSFDDDRNKLKTQILALRKQILANQEKLKTNSEIVGLEIADTLRAEIGLTEVKGEGLEITLSDGKQSSPNDNTGFIHAADLRDIVNLLHTGKAEAISINGQRIIASSPINSVGNTILINNAHVSSPFKILVIGDINFLLDRLKDEKAYPDLYRRISIKKVGLSFKKVVNLTIPSYDGEFLLQYTKKS